jgi:hypothetical protein
MRQGFWKWLPISFPGDKVMGCKYNIFFSFSIWIANNYEEPILCKNPRKSTSLPCPFNPQIANPQITWFPNPQIANSQEKGQCF